MRRSLSFILGIFWLTHPVLAEEPKQPPKVNKLNGPSFQIEVVCEENPQPTTVLLHSGGIVLRGQSEQPNQSPYRIDIESISGKAFFTGTIEAKWAETVSANLGVQIPAVPTIDSTILFFFNPDIEPNIDSIEEFRRRDNSGTNLYKTYFEAKSIYKRTYSSHPKHKVTVLAAYYWHQSALLLSQNRNSIIEMDQEARVALNKVKSYLEEETEGEKVREALNSHGIRETYIAGILNQSGAVEWRHAAKIEFAANQGAFFEASALNKYYSKKWYAADRGEKDAIVKYFKVNDTWLTKNESYLMSLIKGEEGKM